jgi:hypothetical protein
MYFQETALSDCTDAFRILKIVLKTKPHENFAEETVVLRTPNCNCSVMDPSFDYKN